MKSHLWKLALLAALIWLAVVFQSNGFQLRPLTPENRETVPEISLQPQPAGPPEASPAQPSPARATPTQPPPSPTTQPTATLLPVLHTVRQGEFPLAIAAQYGITVEVLLQTNQITDPTGLQIGQQLLIPITATPTPRAATPSPPASSPTPTPEPLFHVVEQGDILLAIADDYETTVEAIMVTNEITDPRSLQVGQRLIIPPDKGSPLGVKTVVHEIRGGDTLLALAARYGSTLDDITATNPDLEPTALRVGQKIVIPVTQLRLNPDADPTLPRITLPAASPPELLALEARTVEAINAERQGREFPALALDEQLASVARAHAQDMVARGYFSHVTLGGLSLRDRLAESGLIVNWTGENIQRNVRPLAEAAPYAVKWFMGSRPHRNNILHSHFDRFGVGVAEGPPGWYTFVVVFAGEG